MEIARNIFFQVDTDEVEALKLKQPTCEQTAESIAMFDKGSMAIGHPIKTFAIEVKKGDDVNFTILPRYLYSHSAVFFTNFDAGLEIDWIQVDTDFNIATSVVNFKISIVGEPPVEGFSFTLEAVIIDPIGGQINIQIDPKLQAAQG
jgi:hypothetical protein